MDRSLVVTDNRIMIEASYPQNCQRSTANSRHKSQSGEVTKHPRRFHDEMLQDYDYAYLLFIPSAVHRDT
jgi:hypothetical protein